MPLPMAHGMAGWSVLPWAQDLKFFENRWITLLFFAFVATLPDADIVPGWILGNPNMYHTMWSHSIGASLVAGAVLAWPFARVHGKFWQYFMMLTLVYFSHIALDFFNNDTRPPFGVMALWPLTSEYFLSPWPVFDSVHKSSDSSTFVASVLSVHNLKGAMKEFFTMLPILLVSLLLNKFWLSRKQLRE